MLRGKDPTTFTVRVANGSNEVVFLSGQTSFGDPLKFISNVFYSLRLARFWMYLYKLSLKCLAP